MRRRIRRFRWPLILVTALALGGGGTAYAVAAGEEAGSYRTATAVKGDVEGTLSLSGAVDAAQRADLAFGTDGTVAKVRVAQGAKVKAGQVIAELDPEALDSAVTKAKADVARAKAQLETTKAGQSLHRQ